MLNINGFSTIEYPTCPDDKVSAYLLEDPGFILGDVVHFSILLPVNAVLFTKERRLLYVGVRIRHS